MMFAPELLATYLTAVLVVVIASGPDNILAVGRGLSQGWAAAGAGYLLWLGFRALTSRSLISFSPADRQPLARVFVTGLLSNVLNPKPGLFVVAFIPQFVSVARGSVQAQMLVYGAVFAVVTAAVFTLLGGFAARISGWLSRRPRVLVAANVGAGLTFVAAGLSILALDRRR